MLDVFLSYPLLYFWGQGLSVSPRLADLARLAGQQAPGISLSHLPVPGPST